MPENTHKEEKYWIGFDLGATKMIAVLFDSQFRVVERKKKKSRVHEGVRAGYIKIKETIEGVLEKADVSMEKVAGIGIGVPGVVEMESGTVLNAANLGWGKMFLRAFLEKEFNRPVAVLNDVDSGVYGEYRFGAASKGRCVIGVFPGTGIGGGCIYNGEILRGSKASCMEIGHLQVIPQGPLCGCGQKGCLETVASRLSIAIAAARAAYIGEAPHLMEYTGSDLTNIRSKALAASIAAGDTAVEAIVRNAAQWLGFGVATMVNLLAPDVIVLGGGLVEAIPGIFREVVLEAANGKVMKPFKGTFKVTVAKLGDDAVAAGAAGWVSHIISQPGYQFKRQPVKATAKVSQKASAKAPEKKSVHKLKKKSSDKPSDKTAENSPKNSPKKSAKKLSKNDKKSDSKPHKKKQKNPN